MTSIEQTTPRGDRIQWLDNLRTITILMVVLYHVGGVYEAANLWGWFWIVDDPKTITWVGIIGIMFDVMVMPLMFFIAGYLTPGSLDSKTSWSFIKGKIKRLIVPWIIAIFTLIPIYKIIFLYSRNLPQQHWSTYFHITNPNSQNWLWFLPVLFVSNLLYLALTKTKIDLSKISLKTAVLGIFVIGFGYSIIMGGLLGFRSWTLTPLIDFENERLLIYFMIYLLGALCFKQNIFSEKSTSKKLYNILNYTAWLPITLHIFVRIWPFFYPEGYTITPVYRLVWWFTFDVTLFFMMFLMIGTFWRYFDKAGKVWRELNRNSYGVYIIHVIMIGIFGTFLLNTNLPALARYPLLIVSTYLFSNLMVSIYKRLIRKINA